MKANLGKEILQLNSNQLLKGNTMINCWRLTLKIATFFLFSVLLVGCTTAKFSEPITSFQNSINTSGLVIKTYYSELNQFEREVYLNECLYDSEKEVLTVDEHGKPTPLLGTPFSAESIKARTDAIVLIGIYAQRLGELAGSDAPKRFAEGATILGENLSNLADTFNKLGIDASAQNYTKPISTIVGVIGRMYLEKKRDQAVKEAIEKGAPAVTHVLDLLQQDLIEVIQPLRKTGLKEMLADPTIYYNDHRSDSFEKRRKRLKEIDIIAARYEVALTSNPANLVQHMRSAHEALVNYAKSPKNPQNLAQLVEALETFRNNVQEIAAAVQNIRELRKGGK